MDTHTVKFGEPGWQQYFIKRNREIMVLVDQGRTLASIAREFHISRPRVEQIKRKEMWRRKYGKEADLRLKENRWRGEDEA